VAKDTEARALVNRKDNLRKERNQVQDEVTKKIKAKEPCDELKAKIKEASTNRSTRMKCGV